MLVISAYNDIIFWSNSTHRIQKRVIRIITDSRPRDSCKQLFKKLGIFPLMSQYIFSLLLFIVNNKALFQMNFEIHSINTYLLTPGCRIFLEKLTGLQLVKNFPAFHGTRRFITALTSVRHLSLSWASPIQSIYPHPTSWRSVLILSTHLRLGLPSGLLPSGFHTKTLYSPPLMLYLI